MAQSGGQGSPLLEPPPSHWPWQGLLGVICPVPSWLVPSCSFRMCRTTAVALKACCQAHHLITALPPALLCPPPPPPPKPCAHLPLALSEVLLDLLAHRLVNVLVQGCVPSNPRVRESVGVGKGG